MFYYFGYGSNINLIALKAKGVQPVSSVKGVLKKWSLKFNVQHWFKHEGGMGNIEFTGKDSDFVEGMVHLCKDDQLVPLDSLEAYGIGYDRILVDVETEAGIVKAYTYVGLPDFIDNNCLPTRRYLNIIIRGAQEANLSDSYVEKLQKLSLFTPKDYPKFKPPVFNGEVYTKNTLAENKTYTALLDAVFDMKNARSQLECLYDILGGKDMTMFHFRRHDSSTGNESIEDVLEGNITTEAKNYLNAYLNEYAIEFTYVGRFSRE